jgi:Flp pilus assembly pilin Flp
MLMSVTKLKTCLRRFADNESGAVTVDWVALTAGIVVVGLAVVWYIFENGVNVVATNIVGSLTGIELAGTPTAPPPIGG